MWTLYSLFSQSSPVLSMTKIVNSTSDTKRYPRSSELLVRHADHILRKNVKNVSLTEVEERLRKFIDLFKYVEDKDLFQKFYGKKLANRLIHNMSLSWDLEETAINGLKIENWLHGSLSEIEVAQRPRSISHTGFRSVIDFRVNLFQDLAARNY
eukprot:sb/3473263/